MIDLSGFNFTKAESAYLVANTPLFIIRNLKADQAVIKVSKSFSAGDLIADIKSRLPVRPETSRDRVIPFVLAVALSIKQDRAGLMEISKLETGNYRWLKLVVDALVVTSRPYSVSAIDLSVAPTFAGGQARSSQASNARGSLTATLAQ